MDTVESLRAEVERWKAIQANEAYEAADEELEAVAQARREERERCIATAEAFDVELADFPYEAQESIVRALRALK